MEFWKIRQHLWNGLLGNQSTTDDMLKTDEFCEKKPNEVFDYHEDTKSLQEEYSRMIKRFSNKR